MIKQFGEELVLHAERYVRNGVPIGLAVSQKVEIEHTPVHSQARHDPAPYIRREGGPVDQDDGRARSARAVAHPVASKLVDARESPVAHSQSSLMPIAPLIH